MDDAQANGASQNRGAKRRRTARACEPCRQRKSRCDGHRPACEICTEQRLECFYRDAAPSGPYPGRQWENGVIARLEGRLSDMETSIQNLVADSRAALRERHVPGTPRFNGAESTYHSSNDTPKNTAWPAGAHDSVDGMGSITFSDELSSGFFGGPTSNSAFLQKILLAQTARMARESRTTSHPSDFSGMAPRGLSRPASPPPRLAGTSNPYAIPDRREILRLLDVFFQNAGKLWPYLEQARILGYLDTISHADSQNSERAKLCLLNLVMAFGCTYTPSSEAATRKMERGDVYFQRAVALLPDVHLAVGNLEALQALVLATQYVQGTQRSSQTWAFLGTAVNACFMVGLFQQNPATAWTPVERELRTRTAWMCFVMDRMCSMTYGRPPLLSRVYMPELPSEVALEMLASDEPLSSHAGFETEQPNMLLYTAKLYEILGDIIEQLYQSNAHSEATVNNSLEEALSRVLELEGKLSGWLEDLPESLKPMVTPEMLVLASGEDSSTYRYRIIVTLRYLNVRCLLHRKILTLMLDTAQLHRSDVGGGFIPQVSAASLDVAIKAASETIAIVSHASERQNNLPIWWYSSYFTFTSALVVYGAIVVKERHGQDVHRYPIHELIQSLRNAANVLGKVGGGTLQSIRSQKIVRHLLEASSNSSQASTAQSPHQGTEYRHQGYHQPASVYNLASYPAEQGFYFTGSAGQSGMQLTEDSWAATDFELLFPDGF